MPSDETSSRDGAMPDGAKLVGGVWLPEEEEHMVEMMLHHPGVSEVRDGKATYQIHKLDACLAMLPDTRRRTAVDVGAHVGLWSMWLAEAFQRLHSFEPYPLFVSLFRHNVTNKNTTLHPVALGAETGFCSVEANHRSSGDSFIKAGVGDIPVRTLDSFQLADVDFMKIDVEGFELAVVQGAKETLLRCRPLVCVEQKGKERTNFSDGSGAKPHAALAYLISLGMKPRYEISGDFILDWT